MIGVVTTLLKSISLNNTFFNKQAQIRDKNDMLTINPQTLKTTEF